MRVLLATAAILAVATAFGQDCCKEKQSSSCCSKSGEKGHACNSACCKASGDLCIVLKEIKDKAVITEAFKKHFGAGCTLDANRITIKIPEKEGILLSEILAAAEEGKAQLDESSLSARCMTVWFEEKPETLETKFPEYAFGAPEDGTTSLAFGANTCFSLSDLRKMGKIKQGQFNAAPPKRGCCGSDK